MTGTVTGFTLRGGELWRDPWADYAWLRGESPAHHDEAGDFYVLSRFDDVWNAARDTDTFSSASGLTVAYGEMEALGIGENVPMVFLDPPDHTQFRRLVSRGFTPRSVAELEPMIREFVRDRLESIVDAGESDIVERLFKPLPSFVVAHYLGVPIEDRSQFEAWTEAIVAASSGNSAGASDAFSELISYFSDLIERRRSDPGDDLVSMLVALGDDTVGVMRILGFAFTMVAGGNDTATGLLGGAAELLTERLDQRAKLIDAPALIEESIDEFLRLTSPVQNLARTATRDVELHGTTIPAGRKVLLCYAAANRDPLEFGPTAEEFDVERTINKFMTFSYGAHHCLGASAARLQGRVVIEELLSRCPDFAVDTTRADYAEGPYVRRFRSLPFDPG